MNALDKILGSTFFLDWPEYILDAKKEVHQLREKSEKYDDLITELAQLRAELAQAQDECNKWRDWKPSNDEYIAKIEAERDYQTRRIESLQSTLNTINAERDALAEQLKQYQRMAAVRQ